MTALRLAVGGPLATGPVFFERIDRHPVGVKPVLPIAATQPPGEPTRLDVFRGQLARRLRERVAAADEDPPLGEALDRWELSLFQSEPFRSEQLRDGTRLAARRRRRALGRRAARGSAAGGGRPGPAPSSTHACGPWSTATTVTRPRRPSGMLSSRHCCTASVAELVAELDESLLGLRPRPGGRLLALAAEPAVASAI